MLRERSRKPVRDGQKLKTGRGNQNEVFFGRRKFKFLGLRRELAFLFSLPGGGEPAGTVFKARKVVGHTSQPGFADAKITSRILWLEGLEPGFNRGGNVDSHARYIYLHGTADQMSIGKPASCGCIHLADADLIPLFDKLPDGTLVWIAENDSPPA